MQSSDSQYIDWKRGDVVCLTVAQRARFPKWDRCTVLEVAMGRPHMASPKAVVPVGLRVVNRGTGEVSVFFWDGIAGRWNFEAGLPPASPVLHRTPTPVEPKKGTTLAYILHDLQSGHSQLYILANRAAISQASASARIRELRGMGWNIEKRKVQGSRQPTYHLVQP